MTVAKGRRKVDEVVAKYQCPDGHDFMARIEDRDS